MKNTYKGLGTFFLLWSTQSLSQLGSAMTNFALTLWLYERTGSALRTALLSICSYAPYVTMSIFAGALSDRWDKRRTMLACDAFAACCSVAALLLLEADLLRPAHLYALNAINGLMNTVQQPAGDVAMTLIVPKSQYQRASGLRSLSNSLVTILHPMLATALFALAGMEGVILADLSTFAVAFLTLLFRIRIPEERVEAGAPKETLRSSMRAGLSYLRENRLILTLILFLAGVNFVASAFDAALPPYVLSRTGNSEAALGLVSACAGIATLAGSLLATVLPAPRDRIRAICLALLFSLGTENFLLAFTRTPGWWCLAQILGWLPIPMMNANLDVILRGTIPTGMQGRVYACRNALQFFTIPIGTFAGGFLVDCVEPMMARANPKGLGVRLFGAGAGSGAALVMLLLGAAGVAVCLCFGRILRRYRFAEPDARDAP